VPGRVISPVGASPYDAWQLFTRYADRLDFKQARHALVAKAHHKGFTFSTVADFLTPQNRQIWARSWEPSLQRQIPVLAGYDEVVAEVERALIDFLALANDI
jgi:hypothetical protein